MNDSCDLDLVFSMLNRFLRNSWCLPLQVLSLLMRLRVYRLPSKSTLLSQQLK